MKDDIQATIQRTQRYWYVDGLSEIGTGSVILLMGLFYFALSLAQPGTVTALVVGVGQPVIILGGFWLASKAVTNLKERITYPRTGYVSYPRRSGKRRWGVMATSAVIAIGLTLGVTQLAASGNRALIPVVTAALIALALALLGYRFSLQRFYVLGILVMLIGLLIAWLGLTEPLSTALFFSLFGLCMIAAGTITLIRYLHATQPLVEEL